jgi:hypothetical protein
MLQAHLDVYFDATQTVQIEQMKQQERKELLLITTEKKFTNNILLKKTQELKLATLRAKPTTHDWSSSIKKK